MLNNHIGLGKHWDMDRMNGGIEILAPHIKTDRGEWYKGTANAVYQNLDFAQKYDSEYVLILSGDNIYKMDYSKLINYHRKKNADVTISVMPVPWDEASRFGLINMHDDGKIYEFEEKPAVPKSNFASMGVYIFKRDVLEKYLEKDANTFGSDNDFGKNILPMMLHDDCSMWTYKFNDYWRDVGTVKSYWESSIDLIKRIPEFNMYDSYWKIYTQDHNLPAHFIGENASIKESIIAEGCYIDGTIERSVIFPGVIIEKGTKVTDSIVMSFSNIAQNCKLSKSILCERVNISDNVEIGIGESISNYDSSDIYNSDITVIGEFTKISSNITIGKNVMIDSNLNISSSSCQIGSGQSIYEGGECCE
jgi:glucose-1-phosphate adenylyltransferase